MPQRARGGAELSSFHRAQSPSATSTQGSVATRVGAGRVPAMRMRCQHRQAAQRALGRPVLHSKHHTEAEMLQPPGSPGELRPPAPPLDSHLAEGREKYKSGRTSDLTQGQQLMAAAPHRGQHPPKCTGTPFLRGGCQTSPFSPPTPPPPLLGSTYLPCCLTWPRGAPAYLQGRKEESHRQLEFSSPVSKPKPPSPRIRFMQKAWC